MPCRIPPTFAHKNPSRTKSAQRVFDSLFRKTESRSDVVEALSELTRRVEDTPKDSTVNVTQRSNFVSHNHFSSVPQGLLLCRECVRDSGDVNTRQRTQNVVLCSGCNRARFLRELPKVQDGCHCFLLRRRQRFNCGHISSFLPRAASEGERSSGGGDSHGRSRRLDEHTTASKLLEEFGPDLVQRRCPLRSASIRTGVLSRLTVDEGPRTFRLAQANRKRKRKMN